jgi:hypothetical protein
VLDPSLESLEGDADEPRCATRARWRSTAPPRAPLRVRPAVLRSRRTPGSPTARRAAAPCPGSITFRAGSALRDVALPAKRKRQASTVSSSAAFARPWSVGRLPEARDRRDLWVESGRDPFEGDHADLAIAWGHETEPSRRNPADGTSSAACYSNCNRGESSGGKTGGRYWIRTSDFHRVRMAL